MSIPANAKQGDFFLVSFDGKNPNISNPEKWLLNGGAIRVAQFLDGSGFGQFEHAAIYIGSGHTVEATNSGTKNDDAHEYDNNQTMWSTGIIDLTLIQRAAIVDAALSYVGTPYSWTDYAALVAHRLHVMPAAPMLKNFVSTDKHMICSQLVDQCYQNAGVQLFNDNRWPGYVTPGDLWQMLRSTASAKGKWQMLRSTASA